jgi:uncharacterized protein
MLKDILLVQKREAERRLAEPYVDRDVPTARLSPHLVQVVVGPRRAGKSTFALHRIQALGRFGYVNFDDERLEALGDGDALVAAVNDVFDAPQHLLLDEIQNLPRWELVVNRLQRQGLRLTITGSNAHLLSAELATHLTGRHQSVAILPFSFAETLRWQGKDPTEAEKAAALRRYVETGGYPEPLVKGIPHRDYLSTLFRATLHKDIVTRHRIRDAQGLEDLSLHLLSNAAREFTARSLAGVTRCRSALTVDKYLRYLEEAFLYFPVRRFSYKTKELVRAPRKAYGIDNGLLTSVGFRSSPDLGPLYENAVAVALRRRELSGEIQAFSWKSAQQEEVDFVVKEGTRVMSLIQVCVRPGDRSTREREIRALVKASDELRCKDLLVLTDADEREESVSWFGLRGTVRFRPLWKWLLE